MRQKEKALLSFLIEHNGEYVTIGYLASKLSLSDRTVRTKNYLIRI
ncbi:HTH domain-containing protein [Enterococcus devriesei]